MTRAVALLSVGVLVVVGLVVGAVLPRASAAPVISLSADVPVAVLSGESIPIRLTASNPAGSPGQDVYNLSFNYALPPGVVYAPGSSTIDLGRGARPAAEPLVVPVYDASEPPVLDHYVLVWQNVSDLVAGATATLGFMTTPDPDEYIVGTTVPSGTHAGAYASTDPRNVPDFVPATGMAVPDDADSSAEDPAPGPTQISAISITKTTGDAPENELMRGVHDQVATVTLTVEVTDQPGGVAPATVVDWLPANLEFLGCGGVDNSTVVTEEYPGSGPLGQAAPVPGCLPPAAVETVEVTDPIPGGPSTPGVYTKVTWGIAEIASGSSATIRYQTAVPMFENTAAWPGDAPPPASGLQGSNLDNNTGASTREPSGGPASARNTAQVSGVFGGDSASGPGTTQTDSTSLTVTVHDLAVQKALISPSRFTPGQNAVFELTIRSSEYTSAEGLRLVDTLPNGMCPMVPAGFPDYPADAPQECLDHHASAGLPSNAAVESVAVIPATGEFELVLVPAGTAPGAVDRNAELVVRYEARMLQDYLDTRDPTVAGDDFGNSVVLAGTTVDADGVEAEVENDSSATIGTDVATIEKSVATRPAAAAGGPMNCSAVPAGDWTSGPVGPQTTFQQGDVVCFRLVVDFADTVTTRNAQIQDFIPDSLAWSTTNWSYDTSTFLDGIALATASTTEPLFLLGTPDVNAPGGPGDRYVRAGSVLTLYLWGTVQPTEPTTQPDLDGNLMKYREVDTEGRVTALRDDAGFAVLPARMTLGKTADKTVVQAGETVAFTIRIANDSTVETSGGTAALPFEVEDVRVWDALPAGFGCADATVPASADYAASCVDPASLTGWTGPAGTAGVIVWEIPGPIAPQEGMDLSYTVLVPSGLGVALDYVNTASVVAFSSPTTAGTDVAYHPESPLAAPPATGYDSPSATDDWTLRTRDLAVTKTATPVNAFAASGQNPGFATAADVVPGQRVDYSYSTSIPAGLSVYQAVLSDALPAQLSLTGATVTATLPDGTTLAAGASAGGFSLSAAGVLTFPATYTNPSTIDAAVATVHIAGALVSPTASVSPPTGSTPLPNTATLTTSSQPVGGTTRTATATASVALKSPAVAVTKTPSPASGVAIGQPVAYTIQVSSTGASALFDTVVVDCLPGTMTFGAFGTSPAGVTAASTPGTGANGCATGTTRLSWTWDAAAPILTGTPQSVAYTAAPNTGVASTSIPNQARATGSSLPNGANDAGVEQVVAQNANGSITLANAGSTKAIIAVSGATPSSPTVYATQGDVITYRASVTLGGGLDYPQLTIRDTLPGNVALVAGSFTVVGCVDSASVACSGVTSSPTALASAGTTVGFLFGNITAHPLDRTITVEYQARVNTSSDLARNATINNSIRASWRAAGAAAPASAADGQFAYNGTPTVAQARVKLPLLTVAKTPRNAADTASVSTAKPGDTLTYAIQVTNANNAQGSTAYNVVVTDTVPKGLIVGTVSHGGVATPNPDGTTTIVWDLDPIANGGAAPRLTYQVALTDSTLLDGTSRQNTARVDYATLPADGRQRPAVSTSATVTLQFPRVALAKALTNPAGSATTGPSYIGDTATWTLTLTNTGTAPAATVTPTDTLPPNWEFVSSTLRIGAGPANAFTPTSTTGGVIAWPAIPGLGTGVANQAVITLVARPTADVVTSPGVGASTLHTNTLSAVATDANGATGNGAGGAFASYAGADATATTRIDSADVRVVKTAAATGTLVAGTTGTGWTVVVSNAGPDTAVGPFTVTDTLGALPAGVTAGTPTGTGWTCGTATAPATWSCTRTNPANTLASGASFPTITIPLTVAADVPDGTTVGNTAVVAARTYDPTPANNTSSATVTIVARAALQVDKNALGPFAAGQAAAWTIDTRNLGPSIARYPITMTDTLPASGIGTVAITAGAGWDCPATAEPGTSFTCAYAGTPGGGLAVGDSLPQLSLSAPIPASTTGSLVNRAEADSATTRPTRPDTPWIDTTTTPVSDATALTIVKDLVGGEIVPGTTADYSFTVTNTGTPNARTVAFTDALPSGLAFASVVAAGGWDCSATAVGATTLSCSYGILPGTGSAPGNATTFVIRVAVASSATGTIANTGRATWANGPGGTPGEATGSTSTGATIVADLAIEKSQDVVPVAAGSTHEYWLTVANNGTSDAPAGVVVSDPLPAGLAYVSHEAPAGWSCGVASNTLTCTSTAPIPAGTTGILFTIVGATDPAATPTTLTNTAAVAVPADVIDPVTTNNSATVETPITTRADVTIDKSGPATFAPGEDVSFTLEIVNAGPSIARTVAVSDLLPDGMTLLSMTYGTGDPVAWDCPAVATGLCTIATLPVGTSTIAVTASTLDSIAADTVLTNEALVSWRDDSSPVERTDTAEHSTTAAPENDLTVAKDTTTPELVGGQDAVFELVVTNPGPSLLQPGAVVVDTLPVGMRYLSSSSGGTDWSCVADAVDDTEPQPVRCTSGETLGVGVSSSTLTLTVSTDPAFGIAGAQTVTNPAVVTWADARGPRTSPEDTADVVFGSLAAVTIVKSHDASAVRVGDPLDFELVVANSGPSAATGIVVTDTLPTGLDYTGFSGTGWSCTEPTPGTVSCETAEIVAPGAVAAALTITVEVLPAAYPGVANAASVVASNDLTPDETTDPVVVPPLVDLQPTKTVQGEARLGGTAEFLIEVVNDGPTELPYDAASGFGGLRLVDTLPTGLAYLSASSADPAFQGCSAVGQVVACAFDRDLAVGAGTSLTLVVDVLPTAPASVTNVVVAETNDGIEQVPGDHSDSETVSVVTPMPELEIVKTALAGGAETTTAAPGDTLVYRLEVAPTAASDGTAYHVVVTDTVPAMFDVDPDSITGGGSAVVNPDGTTTITWTLADIADDAAEPVVLEFEAALADSSLVTGSPIANTGRVGWDNLAVGATVAGIDSDDATIQPLLPTVTLGKALSSSTPSSIGVPATWTITAANTGGADAASVVLTDVLPANWAFDGATIAILGTPGSTPLPGAASGDPQTTVVLDGFALPAGATAVVTVTATPTAAVVGDPGVGSGVAHVNTVSAVATDATGATGNDTPTRPYAGPAASAQARIDSADVAIAKTAIDEVAAGLTTPAAWTITVSNLGDDVAAGPFAVADALDPAGDAGITMGQPTGDGWSCTLALDARSFSCERSEAADTLAAGTAFPAIAVPAAVAPGVAVGTEIDNTATVSAGTYDPDEDNNTAGASLEVTDAEASLTLVKTASAPFTAGTTATWELDVTNTGPAIARWPITIEDTLPAGIGAATGSGGGAEGAWSCEEAGGVLSCAYTGAGDGLSVGASAPALTVTAPVLSSTTANLSNHAEAGSATPFPPVTPGEEPWIDDTDTPVGDDTVLTVGKTAVGDVVPGAEAVFAFTVTNVGTPDARAVAISDPLPVGMAFVGVEADATSAGWDCSATPPDATTVSCALGAPLPGSANEPAANVTTLAIRVSVPATVTETIVNTVTATWENCATDDCSTTGSWTDDPTITADLAVVKSGPASILAGQGFTYSFTVTNNGPSQAGAGVVLADAIPAPFVADADSIVAPAGWGCGLAGSVLTCTSTDVMAPGDEAEFSIDVAVPATAGASVGVRNTATVAVPAGTIDPIVENNASSVDTAIGTSADVTILKTAPATAAPGTSIAYTLTVLNEGPSVARAASVLDVPPPGVTITGMADDTGDDVAWSCPSGAEGPWTCTVAQLPVGTSTITVTATIASSVPDGAVLTNLGRVTWSDSQSPTPHEHEDTADTTAVTSSVVTLEKSTSTPTIDAGEQARFSLVLGNAGPSDLVPGATIVETLPAELSLVSFDPAGGAWELTDDAGPLVFTLTVGVPAGGSAPALSLVTASDPAIGMPDPVTLTNLAVATWADGEGGGETDEASADVEVGSRSAVSATKEHDAAAVRVGDDLDFVIVVSNAGPSSAVGVTVREQLPAELLWAGVAAGVSADWTCEPDADDPSVVDCAYAAPIGPGLSAEPLVIVATVTAEAYPATVNTILVGAANDPEGPVVVEDPVIVPALVNLVPTKEIVGQLVAGSDARFRITVTNEGPTPTDAFVPGPVDEETGEQAPGTGGLTVTDTLPAGFTFVRAIGEGVECTAEGLVVTCFVADALGVDETIEFELVAAIHPDVRGEVENVVVVTTDAEQVDPDPESHTARARGEVLPPPPLPWTGAAGGAPATAALLALLALLLGAGALIRSRRRA